LELLEWARKSGAILFEDDYDSEFRFDGLPVPSLQGLDGESRVIYIGTFSKVLFPSVRVGYIVIPRDLVERFTAVRYSMDICPPSLIQSVLDDFLRNGHFVRHLRRMRAIYRERHSAMLAALGEVCGSLLQVQGDNAGIHVTVTLPEGYDDVQIATRAAADHLWLWPLSPCYLSERPSNGFILGFGSVTAEDIPTCVKRMKKVIEGSTHKLRSNPNGSRRHRTANMSHSY